jgi:TRAP-type C4-dicarboxylate transport system substrate-binding protein
MRMQKILTPLAGIAAVVLALLAGPASAKELKYITFKPQSANDAQSITMQWFADEFKRRTGGKHTMKIFWGGSVAGIKEVPDALETGVGDIGDLVAPYFQDQFLLNNIVTFFSPQPRSEIELGEKLIEWYEQYPQFDEEMKKYNLKIVGWRPLENYGIICTKPVKSADDLKGLRIRTYGHALPRLFEALGATPVSMSTPEAYEALERNILDCSPIGVTLARGWRYEEVAKYFVKLPLGANWGHYITMNRKSYDALDDQTRAILEGLGREYVVHYVSVLNRLTQQILKEWEGMGVKVLPFPAGPVAKAVQSEGVQKVRREFIERATAKGIPAAELVQFFAFD